MHLGFLESLKPAVEALTVESFTEYQSQEDFETLQARIQDHIPGAWFSTGILDADERFQHVADSSMSVVLSGLVIVKKDNLPTTPYSIAAVELWKAGLLRILEETYMAYRTNFFRKQDTISRLGRASRILYQYIRSDLGAPFHQGYVEHPSPSERGAIDGRAKKTVGSWISIIYEALRSGDIHQQVIACARAN